MAIRRILKDFKSKGDGFKRSLICDLYSSDEYWRKKTTLNYDVEGWWGSPVSVRFEEENDRGLTVSRAIEIHTSSGGQNGDVGGLEKVRNLIAVLKDAEKQILEAQ